MLGRVKPSDQIVERGLSISVPEQSQEFATKPVSRPEGAEVCLQWAWSKASWMLTGILPRSETS